jgi:hypothetical protein
MSTPGEGAAQRNLSRPLFDPEPLAEAAGREVLAWHADVGDGTRLGWAKVRLPNVRHVDLFAALHCDGRTLWARAARDTPPRYRRRLERDLPLLCGLISRAVGAEEICRLLRQRDDGGGSES